MAPYYQQICEELGWKIDTALLEKMQKGWEPCLLNFSTFRDLFFFFSFSKRRAAQEVRRSVGRCRG